MTKLFESASDLGEYVFRIVDNGGATADRYTVLFSDGDALGLSSYPSHPQGFSQWTESAHPSVLQEWVDEGEAVDMGWYDLPEQIQKHIIARCNEGWRDYMAKIEAGEVVAKGRDAAEFSDGMHSDAGKGMYQDEAGKYWIRREGPADEDFGPMDTPREAMLATLPTFYSLSGPEYHSEYLDGTFINTTPNEDVAKALADLEAKVLEQDKASNPRF